MLFKDSREKDIVAKRVVVEQIARPSAEIKDDFTLQIVQRCFCWHNWNITCQGHKRQGHSTEQHDSYMCVQCTIDKSLERCFTDDIGKTQKQDTAVNDAKFGRVRIPFDAVDGPILICQQRESDKHWTNR